MRTYTSDLAQRNQNQSWQEYLDSATKHFSGTKYADLLAANPYNDYQTGFWDYLGNAFGFATNADKMEQASREYVSQLYQTQREEEYNSETEAAARMRAAGLNPDLTGTSGASQASEFDMPMTSPVLDTAPNIFSGIFKAFDVALGMFSKINDVKSKVLDNDAKEMVASGGSDSIVSNILDDYYGNNAKGFKTNPRLGQISYELPGQEVVIHQLSYNKRNNKRLTKWLQNYVDTPSSRAAFYSHSNASLEGRRKYASEIYSPDSGPENEPAEVMRDVIAPVLKDMFDTKKAGYKRDLQKTENELDYEIGRGSIDPATGIPNLTFEGQADVLSGTMKSKAEYANSKRTLDLAGPMNEIISKLSKSAKDGNMFAASLLITLSALSNSSFSASKGPKGMQSSFSF